MIEFNPKLSALEILQLMQQVYNANSLTKTSVFQWIKYFLDIERQKLGKQAKETIKKAILFCE